jgi:hypothetical protein
MDNWHNSLRKVKNCNKGKSGRKDFLDRWLAEKECAFFRQEILRRMYEKEAAKKKKSQEGLIEKLNANDLCQRKLF